MTEAEDAKREAKYQTLDDYSDSIERELEDLRAKVCLYACICECVCTYTKILRYLTLFIYTHTYTHTYIYIYTYLHTHIHTYREEKPEA